MKTVNGTSIVEKIKDAHDRNQQFHRGRDKPDVCITDEDLDNLNLDHVDIDPLPQSCIDTCAPIGRKVPLAMACAGATCFAAIAILVCSLAAFCSFCCCNPTEPPTYVMVRVAIAPDRIYPDRACLLLQATAFNKSCCLINHFTGTYVVAARSNRSRDLGLCCIIRVLEWSRLGPGVLCTSGEIGEHGFNRDSIVDSLQVENTPSTSHMSGSQQPTGTASYTDPIKQPLMSGSP